MMCETVLQIKSEHLLHNLSVFNQFKQPQTKILINLKGNAYGADAILTGKFLEQHKLADYFSVAYINEGIELRKNNIQTKIIVFNPAINNFQALVDYRLEPEVSSLEYLKSLLHFLQKKNISGFPVHIKFDTGMHRAGIQQEELTELIRMINSQQNISVKSIFSHLAAAEDPSEDDFTRRQIQLFEHINIELKTKINQSYFCHLLNTAGFFRFPEAQYDMIRPGLGIYGFNLATEYKNELKSVFKWVSKISQIITIKKGETVGYNRNFTALKDSRIALVSIGYADGLNRLLGQSKWKVKINNQAAPIIGNISMDTISIDVTGITCQTGDEVIIFDDKNDVYQMAELLQTIPYEITTSITKRVPRELV